MKVRPTRTISLTIIMGVISVGLAIALLVGWTLVVVRNAHLAEQVTQDGSSNVWLLVAGILSLVTIMFALTLLSVFLVKEMLHTSRQTRFIDSVTHELKSPLASLELCLQTLERAGLTEKHRLQLSEMMAADVNRLTAFIDDILTASRLTHGKVTLVWHPIELRALIEGVVEQVLKPHKSTESSVKIDIDGDLKVYSDPTALEMIFKNLIDNAVKYSDPPVSLHITGRAEGKSSVEIEVKDEGIGVPKGQLKHIFKRFYRVPEDDVRARHGSGLGLFVVHALVRGMGGKLTAHSEGRGHGTTMHVRLPVGKHRETEEIPALSPQGSPRSEVS